MLRLFVCPLEMLQVTKWATCSGFSDEVANVTNTSVSKDVVVNRYYSIDPIHRKLLKTSFTSSSV